MIAKDAAGIGFDHIPMLKRLGFDYVELPLAQMMALDDEAFRQGPLAALEASGLPCLSCNNFFPAAHQLTGPEADWPRALAYAEQALARAAALGAKRVVFGSSGARNAPLGFSIDKAHDQLAELLPQLGDLAAKHGITLVIEHLNAAESNLVNSFAAGLALAKRVNHPNVAALADFYHLRLAGEKVEGILEGRGRLEHVHLARVLNRSLPLPGDEEDYAALFQAFKDIGYDGTVSIEAYMPGQTEEDLAVSLANLRSLA